MYSVGNLDIQFCFLQDGRPSCRHSFSQGIQIQQPANCQELVARVVVVLVVHLFLRPQMMLQSCCKYIMKHQHHHQGGLAEAEAVEAALFRESNKGELRRKKAAKITAGCRLFHDLYNFGHNSARHTGLFSAEEKTGLNYFLLIDYIELSKSIVQKNWLMRVETQAWLSNKQPEAAFATKFALLLMSVGKKGKK